MKNLYTRILLVAAMAATVTLSSCSSSLRLQVLKPADITLPSDIQHMTLANRYRPAKGQGIWNVLEGAITGEWIGTDRRGAEVALIGLADASRESPRFTLVRTNAELRGSGLGTFPEPLTPAEVGALCEANQAQALVTIEAFDSDAGVERGTYNKEVKNKEGETRNVLVHTIQQRIRVTLGWRLYHADGTLLDEYRMNHEMFFDAEGNTSVRAERNLPSRERMVQDVGHATGAMYWRRISPMYVWVNRTYYSKGNDALKEAKYRVRVNDWSMAEKFWTTALDDPKDKIAGRAAFNMALAEEMKGNLEGAIDWCKEAYAKYGNKSARQYQRTLQQRLYEQRRLEEQMK